MRYGFMPTNGGKLTQDGRRDVSKYQQDTQNNTKLTAQFPPIKTNSTPSIDTYAIEPPRMHRHLASVTTFFEHSSRCV